MARYKVKQLNYIASGKYRDFVNMDIELEDPSRPNHILRLEEKLSSDAVDEMDIVLEHGQISCINTHFISKEYPGMQLSSAISYAISKEGYPEQIIFDSNVQNFYETNHDNRSFIRITDKCCQESIRQKYVDYINGLNMTGVTFEVEHEQLDMDYNQIYTSSGTLINPIYDMYDVAIKNGTRQTNSTLMCFDDRKPGRSQDIYLPSGTRILGFVQIEDDTYLLTEPTKLAPGYLNSSLRDIDDEDRGHNYTVQIQNKNTKTYVYQQLNQLSSDSYGQALSSGEISSTIDFFSPRYNFDGIKYNYLCKIPTSYLQSKSGVTDYNNGNVYGSMINLKNSYNELYQVELSSLSSLQNCRIYTDVQRSGNKIYLKFYNNIGYTCGDGSNGTITGDVEMGQDSNETYSYQKIEQYVPISMTSRNKHKSTFFSINVSDINMDTQKPSNPTTEENNIYQKEVDLKQRIRKDITNAIRDICYNTTPANTQLFDVFFSK